MTPAERALLERAVEELRRVVTTPPAGTLHYGLFALSRLLEEIAHAEGSEGVVADPVAEAAVEIARHVVDHGVHLTREPPPGSPPAGPGSPAAPAT
ncbi:hypothetical protein [Actinomycetospora sp. CA-053990]|uniref:hypothetical protein n=1 Tax=Actinomycetospora sp. CA-053990 TaxID=3239891 RepID=UPI003D94F108